MDALAYRPIVTVADVLDVGACIDGVKLFIVKNRGLIAAPASDFPDESYIQQAAARADVIGYGYGYGYGDGYGYGYGYGYGDGDGDGYGYGYGDGDG